MRSWLGRRLSGRIGFRIDAAQRIIDLVRVSNDIVHRSLLIRAKRARRRDIRDLGEKRLNVRFHGRKFFVGCRLSGLCVLKSGHNGLLILKDEVQLIV